MMGYYGGAPKDTTCPNCGCKGFEHDKKDYECRKCGFHKIESKELPPLALTYCDGCGCTLSDACELHPPEKQRRIKL